MAKKYLLLLIMTLGSLAQAERKPWPRKPGVVLYQLKVQASNAERAALARVVGPARAASAAAQPYLPFAAPAGDRRDEEELAQELLKTGAVEFAEPDYRMPLAALPNDPDFGLQWYHDSIHSAAAWALTHGSPSVTVAVCDTGVDAAHADLAANLVLPGYNAADHSANTAPVADHGTAVAGIIAALGDNGVGGAGLAWNAKILPVRVTNSSDGSAWCSDMAAGVRWAADHGAQVINLSYDITGCPNTQNAAAQYAQSLGAVTVIAAGNTGLNLSATTFPVTHAFLLVGASDNGGQRALFSNYGAPIDLLAPGVSIYAPQPGNAYAYGTGTSFAAPIVSGVAALLLSLNAHWTPEQVRLFLLATAQPAAVLNGYGRLDAAAALSSAQGVLAGGPVPVLPGQSGPAGSAGNSDLSAMLVYPNPWRADRHTGLPVSFAPLTAGTTVKIFTLSGHRVGTLSESANKAVWDLRAEGGDPAASGMYLYSATDGQGNQAQGQLAVIR